MEQISHVRLMGQIQGTIMSLNELLRLARNIPVETIRDTVVAGLEGEIGDAQYMLSEVSNMKSLQECSDIPEDRVADAFMESIYTVYCVKHAGKFYCVKKFDNSEAWKPEHEFYEVVGVV